NFLGTLARLELQVTAEQLLIGWTRLAAEAAGIIDAGTLAPGKRADFIVLDHPWEEHFRIENASVPYAVFGGAKRWSPKR
ncbi:MAG: amidohydrolase family protein, partial [Bdellovibrionaceae bacterium]|nr:amidohydrolase family protein [Pseudobdellovibrionaceae bacterium]